MRHWCHVLFWTDPRKMIFVTGSMSLKLYSFIMVSPAWLSKIPSSHCILGAILKPRTPEIYNIREIDVNRVNHNQFQGGYIIFFAWVWWFLLCYNKPHFWHSSSVFRSGRWLLILLPQMFLKFSLPPVIIRRWQSSSGKKWWRRSSNNGLQGNLALLFRPWVATDPATGTIISSTVTRVLANALAMVELVAI